MRIIACVLLVAGLASGQSPTGKTISASTPVANESSTGGAVPTSSSAAPATAAAAPAAAAPAHNLGPAFFGPGLNNPTAILPNPIILQQAQRVVAGNTNIRVFVGADGEVRYTDQYGQDVEEIVDQFGRDVTEFIDPQEHLERLTARRRQELERRRQQIELQLLQEFNTNPAAFDPVALGPGGAAPAAPVFRIVA